MSGLVTSGVHVIVPISEPVVGIERLVTGLSRQTLVPDRVVFVLDRCSETSRSAIERLAAELRGTHLDLVDSGLEGEGFYAGLVRDIGLRQCQSNANRSLYLFIDGDCEPGAEWVSSHASVLARAHGPAATCGALWRRNASGVAKGDMRAPFFADAPRRLVYPAPLARSGTWTANLGLNQAAVDRLRAVNQVLAGKGTGRVFNPCFDGSWGGEDDFLGMALFKCQGEIWYLPQVAFVIHTDHSLRRTRGPVEQHRRIAQALERLDRVIERLDEAIVAGRLPGEVTRIQRLTCHAGAGNGLEDLNFEAVEALPSLESWLESSGVLRLATETTRLDGEVLGSILQVLLARTRLYLPSARCRCHDLVARNRALGETVVGLRNHLYVWGWSRDPHSGQATGPETHEPSSSAA